VASVKHFTAKVLVNCKHTYYDDWFQYDEVLFGVECPTYYKPNWACKRRWVPWTKWSSIHVLHTNARSLCM